MRANGQCEAPWRQGPTWRFIVVQGKKAVEALAHAFLEPNIMVKQAPVIIIACARPGDDVMHDGKEYYLFDVGMAVGNMLLAATDLGRERLSQRTRKNLKEVVYFDKWSELEPA